MAQAVSRRPRTAEDRAQSQYYRIQYEVTFLTHVTNLNGTLLIPNTHNTVMYTFLQNSFSKNINAVEFQLHGLQCSPTSWTEINPVK